MTRLPELLDDAVGRVELDFGIDDLSARVVRRRRTRIARLACVVVAIALIATVTTSAITGRRSSAPHVSVRPTAPTGPSDVLVFNDTGGVLTVDLSARVATHHPLRGWRPGDQPFQALRVGDEFVVGWGDVHASPLGGAASRLLGTGVFVAASEPGDVWLTSAGQVETSTDRLVDMRGHVVLEGPTPDEYPLTGIPGGLVLQSDTGLDIWDARSGRITRHLGTTSGSAAPAFGSLLAWCDQCNRSLELTDLVTGVTRSIALALHGDYLAMNGVVFSPDGSQLAIPASPDAVAPIGVDTNVVIVNVATGKAAGQVDSRDRFASAAWSPDSRRIYIAGENSSGAGGEILVHDVATNTTRDLGRVLDGTGGLSSVMTRTDAARMPAPPVGSAEACRPLATWSAPDGDGTLCRYRF